MVIESVYLNICKCTTVEALQLATKLSNICSLQQTGNSSDVLWSRSSDLQGSANLYIIYQK
jgi:hypothetical protein